MNFLVGKAAQIHLSPLPAWRGAQYQIVPLGRYSIGHLGYTNNPPRQYTLEKAIQVKPTVVTQSEFLGVREALGDQNHLVMALLPGNRQTIVARGTETAIGALSSEDILKIVQEHILGGGGLLSSSSEGSFEVHQMQMRFLRFAFRPEWEGKVGANFLGDDYPAYASQYMARAVAALSLEGDRLLTSDEWEVAAGDLRDERYLDPKELAKVAYFGKETPTRVGTLEVNSFGLYDMLGLVGEYVAEERVLRGGFWSSSPEDVRTALFFNLNPPDLWYFLVGFRLTRPHQTAGGQAQDSPG